METCDDCHKTYAGPAYYTFEADGCRITVQDPITGAEVEIPHDCTENMCPDCAGPYLEPDTDGDPRRPSVTLTYALVQIGEPIGSDMGIGICLGHDVVLVEDMRIGLFTVPGIGPRPVRVRIVEADRDLTRALDAWLGMPSTSLLAYQEVG